MTELEPADQYISLARASQLSGVGAGTLSVQARRGRLQTHKMGPRMLVTTRRWLHEYLMAAEERDKGRRKPLPEGYQAPE